MLKPMKITSEYIADITELQGVKKLNSINVEVNSGSSVPQIKLSFKNGNEEIVDFDNSNNRDEVFKIIEDEIFNKKGLPIWAKEQAKRRREKENEDNPFRNR